MFLNYFDGDGEQSSLSQLYGCHELQHSPMSTPLKVSIRILYYMVELSWNLQVFRP